MQISGIGADANSKSGTPNHNEKTFQFEPSYVDSKPKNGQVYESKVGNMRDLESSGQSPAKFPPIQ